MNKLTLALATAFTLTVSGMAYAQYSGPATQKPLNSVAEINKNPVDDTEVRLRGVLLKKIGHEKYVFSDGTGEIRVEIDSEDLPGGTINENTKVEIRGEVEKEFMETPEIDVDMVSIVQ